MHRRIAFPPRSTQLCRVLPAAALAFALAPASGQQINPGATVDLATSRLVSTTLPFSEGDRASYDRASLELAALPDAPGVSSSAAKPEPSGQIANQKEGSQPSLNPLQRLAHPLVPTSSDITIAPGQVGPRQTAGDKLLSSLRDSASPFSIAGEIISAGYSQGIDSSPHYGRDVGAFGQRVGASIARGTSQKIFSEGILAAVLHEDVRYYQLGSKQNFFKRVLYAGTRPAIARTDAGRTTPNLATIGGYLGAAALAQTYYPGRDQSANDVLRTWGTGLGGAAIGDEITEFLPDFLQFVHLKRVSHR